MSALDDLVGLLDLEVLEVNLFRGESLDADRAGDLARGSGLPRHPVIVARREAHQSSITW